MLLLQKASAREIDTSSITRIYSVGECNPEPVQIVLNRFMGESDLSEWQFRICGVNAAHEPVYQDISIHNIHESTICLNWKVERTFTSFAGILHLELHAHSANTPECIHYQMGDIWISPSVWGSGMPLIPKMQEIYCQMQNLYNKIVGIPLHLPKISEKGTWLVFDINTGVYVDSNMPAKGLSAYEIAVENGFDGTVEEWLESLKSESGMLEISESDIDKIFDELF